MRSSKEELTNVIRVFETQYDYRYNYTKIAETKHNEIAFYTAIEGYDSFQWYGNNDIVMVARCSKENMKNIINSKLEKKQYYVGDKSVYLIYTEKDFDETEANKMKKYVKFPLCLDYHGITNGIFANNIDKNIESKINSILKENEETKKECINANNNNVNNGIFKEESENNNINHINENSKNSQEHNTTEIKTNTVSLFGLNGCYKITKEEQSNHACGCCFW